MTAKCEQCGKEFERENRRKKRYKHTFCSVKCHSAYRSKKMSVACTYCGKELERKLSYIKRSKHVFCSNKCLGLYRRKRTLVICEYCGKEFEKNDCYIERVGSHFCSRDCFIKGTARGDILICQNCGKEFYRVQSQIVKSLGGFFCSHECYTIWNKGENHYLWLGDDTLYSRDFDDARKLVVRSRDNFTCQECGYTEEQLGYILRVHHIDYDKSNSALSNLISLCKSCHAQSNFKRDDWTRYFQAKLKGLVADDQILLPFMGGQT